MKQFNVEMIVSEMPECVHFYEMRGECMPLGTKILTQTETSTDPIVGYDMGDLLTDLDNQMGGAIERTVNRYLDRELARHIRREVVKDIGEKIAVFDRITKEAQT